MHGTPAGAVDGVDHEVRLLVEVVPLDRAVRRHDHEHVRPVEKRVEANALVHDATMERAVLPGEVVTQDPWGEMARGQYAVLLLDDKDAVRERVLRVRP